MGDYWDALRGAPDNPIYDSIRPTAAQIHTAFVEQENKREAKEKLEREIKRQQKQQEEEKRQQKQQEEENRRPTQQEEKKQRQLAQEYAEKERIQLLEIKMNALMGQLQQKIQLLEDNIDAIRGEISAKFEGLQKPTSSIFSRRGNYLVRTVRGGKRNRTYKKR